MILINIFSLIGFAQSTRYFEKHLGRPAPNYENTYWVAQLSNGGYITFGDGENTRDYAVFMKTDSYGNMTIDSAYLYGNVDSDIWKDAKFDSDSTLIILGYTRYENVTPSDSMWILKIDTSGQIIWSSLVGDSVLWTDAYCLAKALDGGYILGGIAGDTSDVPKGCVIKTDSVGTKLWERIYDVTNFNYITGVVATSDSGFAFTGSKNYFFPEYGNTWMLKLDKHGNTIKDTTYHFDSFTNLSAEWGSSIGLSHDGGYIIGGYLSDNSIYGYSGLLIKLDSNFVTVWHKIILDPQNSGHAPAALEKIIILSDGNIVCSGFYDTVQINGYEAYIIKFDSNGNEMWRRDFKLSPYANSDYAYSIDTTSDGGFIMCGRTEIAAGADVLFIKTNCLGFIAPPTASFTDSLGSLSTIYFRNNSENTDTCFWNWGDGSPIQMVREDSTVPVLHHYTTSDSHRVTLIAIACGEIDSIAIITPFVTGITNPYSDNHTFIYPNPNDGSFTLHYSLPSSHGEFLIKDVTGRLLYSTTISGTEGTQAIDVSTLAKGIYYWEVVSINGIEGKGKLAVIK